MVIIIGLAAATAAFFGVALLTWIGIRNGDQPGDVQMHACLEPHHHRTGYGEAHVTLVNPSDRPVVTAIRTGNAPSAPFRLDAPLAVHTRRTSPTMPPPDAIIEAIPAMSTRKIILEVELTRKRRIRIDIVAFERPGRVRHITRLLHPSAPVSAWSGAAGAS